MKLIRLIAAIFLLSFSLYGFAQNNTPLLDRHVSVNINSVPLQEALFTLSEKADFNLSFNSDILPTGQLVSLNCDEKRLTEVFSSILPAEIEFKTSGNNVILVKKTDQKLKKRALIVKGIVIDAGSGQRLENVTVLDIYGSESTLTDSTGKFELFLSHKQQELLLSISKYGYKDSSVILLPESQKVLLSLQNLGQRKAHQLDKIESIPIKTVETYQLSRLMIPKLLVTHSENIKGYTERWFQLSLTPGTSSNLKIAGTVKNDFSINLIGGYNYGVNVLELGGAFNINRTDVKGLQVAGLVNLVGRDVSGLQFSGIANRTRGNQRGAQLAGIGNFNLHDFFGLQMSGVSNHTEKMEGAQVGGITNFADSLHGFQLSSVYNKSKFLDGVQISAGLNVAVSVKGVQIGIVNRAAQQSGFQLGIVNIKDESEGLSIGLLNFVKRKKFPRIGFAYK